MSHSYLADVLIILVAAVACVPLCERVRLGPVLGYLIAGVLIGPGGFALIANLDATRALGELGVVFLLFTIGLEFTPERLKLIRPRVYGLGVLQILLTAVAIAAVARFAAFDWPQAVIMGGALALSSTAIVLPVLAGLGALNSRLGRMAVAVLLLQDLAVGPLLVLVETLGRGGGPLAQSLLLAVVKAGAAIIVITVIGRRVLQPVFRAVAGAKSPEVFVGMALLAALGTAWGTEQAGLSMAFGGFLAGMLLGETEFRHQVAADVEPFRGLLLGLFFMAVGMTVDVDLVVDSLGWVALLAVGLMAGKALVLVALGTAFGMKAGDAWRLGGLLSQGGEFAFIAFVAAAATGLIEAPVARLLIAVVAVTMFATPLAAVAARWLAGRLRQRSGVPKADELGEALDLRDHVIIVGFGEIGRIVARMLKAYGLSYVVIDTTPERIRQGRSEAEPVFFGDATRPEVLRGVRAEAALAVVVTTVRPGVAEGLAALRRHAFPDLRILVRGGGEQAIVELRRAGLTPVGQEATEMGLKLTGAVIDLLHPAAMPGER